MADEDKNMVCDTVLPHENGKSHLENDDDDTNNEEGELIRNIFLLSSIYLFKFEQFSILGVNIAYINRIIIFSL
jgi:hypothetical protein